MSGRAREGNPSERTRAIAARIRRLRGVRLMSVKNLAEATVETGTPVPYSVLVNLEHDRRDNITVDELYTLAHVLGTTPEWLADSQGAMCSVCQDAPPAGFSCLSCGAAISTTTEESDRA